MYVYNSIFAQLIAMYMYINKHGAYLERCIYTVSSG